MAYSQDPRQSTYQKKEIFLLNEYNSRNSSFTKDVDYANTFFEINKNKTTGENNYFIFPRAGLEVFSQQLQSTNVRHIHYWEDRLKYYVWVDDDLQIVNGTTGVIETTLTGVLGTSTGDVGATEFLYDDGTVKLVFTDGASLKTIDSANTIVASTSPDLPTPIDPSLIFLDGYLFCVKQDTADIYNSNLNDPLLFTAGDFISAEMLPDQLLFIARLNNYLLAFGSNSIEYFWDAANATGSPLQRNDTPVKLVGYLGGFAQIGNRIYFVGNNTESIPSVFSLEDFKINDLSLKEESWVRHIEATTDDYSTYQASIVAFNAHVFYVLNVGMTTYALDINSGFWSRWQTNGSEQLPILYSGNSKTTTRYLPVVYMQGRQFLDRFNTELVEDFGNNIVCSVVTKLENFDNYHEKSMSRLIVVGDRPSVDSNVFVSWTDDDYQTFSSERIINMNQWLPDTTQLGSFRRRAFKLRWEPQEVFRITYLEVFINIGAS